jgi:hypothetical protein
MQKGSNNPARFGWTPFSLPIGKIVKKINKPFRQQIVPHHIVISYKIGFFLCPWINQLLKNDNLKA